MTRPYSTFAVADLLDAFASNEPVPGGGSAAALAGALGVSLLLMVAGLPKTKSGTPEETADLAEASARLRPLRDTLTSLIDADSDAYRGVLAAYRLPKETDEDKARRRDAIAAAMRQATDVPLDTMRVCQQAIRGAVVVAKNGTAAAASDVGVAIELLMASLRGAGLNVGTNVAALKDQEFVTRASVERRALEVDGAADAERARALL
jgi:formiminotetrahydrofolate cyclodeaminase